MAKKESQAIYIVKNHHHKKLKLLSFKLDRSMSDLVREALDDLFKKSDMAKIIEDIESKIISKIQEATADTVKIYDQAMRPYIKTDQVKKPDKNEKKGETDDS